MRASDRKNYSKAQMDEEQGLSLTSLMDIMTIILLFLLQTFSADGNLIKKDPENSLTYSTAGDKAKNSSTIIVTPTEVKLKKSVDSEIIDTYTTTIAAVEDSVMVYDNLFNGLSHFAEEKVSLEKELRKQNIDEGVINDQIKWELIVEADKNTPYSTITKVMLTCGKAGFVDIKLLTIGE